MSFSQSTTLLPSTFLVVSLALYLVPQFLTPLLYCLLVYYYYYYYYQLRWTKLPHFSFLVKKEVFGMECGLIVIDLTPCDDKSNTTSIIGSLIKLS